MTSRTVYLHRAEIDAAELSAAIMSVIASGGRIFNAPRPLLGLDWIGDCRHGSFYAVADDPKQIARNEQLDGWPVEIVDDAEIIRLTNQEVERLIRDERLPADDPLLAELRTVGSQLWEYSREQVELPPLSQSAAISFP